MECQIAYKDAFIRLRDSHFSSLIELTIKVAEDTLRTREEKDILARMISLQDREFQPGRGMQIETDFPELSERRFWARVFLDTARGIFERQVGEHGRVFWQAQRIYQAYATGLLFQRAVRERHPKWIADSRDHLELGRALPTKGANLATRKRASRIT